MKGDCMKKILSTLFVCAAIIVLTGCVNPLQKTNNGSEQTPATQPEKASKKANINNNDDYFIIVKGKKFKAGDKISGLSKVGLTQDSRVTDQTIGKKTYLIGGGSMYNSDDKNICSITPFNASTSESITAADAVIGGFEVGSYDYESISEDVLKFEFEVAGGIKLGSSLEDVQKAFGTTENTYVSDSLGYTTYTYKSDEVYRSYEITVDKDGKVCKLRWQNLVF